MMEWNYEVKRLKGKGAAMLGRILSRFESIKSFRVDFNVVCGRADDRAAFNVVWTQQGWDFRRVRQEETQLTPWRGQLERGMPLGRRIATCDGKRMMSQWAGEGRVAISDKPELEGFQYGDLFCNVNIMDSIPEFLAQVEGLEWRDLGAAWQVAGAQARARSGLNGYFVLTFDAASAALTESRFYRQREDSAAGREPWRVCGVTETVEAGGITVPAKGFRKFVFHDPVETITEEITLNAIELNREFGEFDVIPCPPGTVIMDQVRKKNDVKAAPKWWLGWFGGREEKV